MKILIIEDEAQAAWDLKQTIQRLKPDYEIIAAINSAQSARQWLTENDAADLIFSDINLGDGLIFEVLEERPITCPIIFCTAYDEYMLQAFKTNGIDYLLKPISEKEVEKSLSKLNKLKQALTKNQHDHLSSAIQQILNQQKVYKSSFLIPWRDKMIPIGVDRIACFGVTDSGGKIFTTEGRSYIHPYTLDYLVSVLDPVLFYRANRQYIVAFNAINEIENYYDRKLLVHLKHYSGDPIIVSKAKASAFLEWLEKR